VELVSTGVYRLRTLMVNVFFVETGSAWVLVDAGIAGSASAIRAAAEQLFGPGAHPLAILLTHGHFDHVGALKTLADEWRVPVYAHPLELPYLTGQSPYPPPDPTVGGGLLALSSLLYPRGPYDFGARISVLPEGGHVPVLPAWQWIHTPGHTPGHVSFFRESDMTLIAGDAVVTTKQESLTWVVSQREEVWRPPAYYTPDWESAGASVRHLAALEPEHLATGHGRSMHGETMRRQLKMLAFQFSDVKPHTGRYVDRPAIADAHGVVSIPPRAPLPRSWRVAAAVSAIGIVGLLLQRTARRNM